MPAHHPPVPGLAVGGALPLGQLAIAESPFPHVRQEQFLPPEVFAQLAATFPTCPPGISPTGFALFRGDPGYERLLHAEPVWQQLHDAVNSQDYLEWALAQFAPVWERDGCLIDLAQARYVPYCETREDKERTSLRQVEHAPDEFFVRLDIHQGHVGYRRKVHVDHTRRLTTMLIYLNDQHDIAMQGGELLLHGAGPSRWLHRPRVVTPTGNLMVAFPCSRYSYHSVPRITSMKAPRNYLQIQISSSVDAWTRR